MNKRKLVDYTSMYEALNTLMKTELLEVELYFEIGWAVCTRPEKGAAVMAAEHLQASCPESKGFSPRNLRRMREFYRAYADSRELQALALKLGWTQNVAILEGCEGSQERAWYLRAAQEHHWTKTELMEQIQAGAWLQEGLDELGNTCYTESNTVSAGCLEHEEDPFCVSRQYLSESDGRVCDEGLDEKVRSGGGVPDRLGGHQPGGDWQPGLPSGPAEAGGARHPLREPRRPAAPQPRLRGIRPLIGMDRANLRSMYRICGGDFNDKMPLLMEYAGRLEQEVADPWYTDDFDATWRDVLAGCQGLLDQIITQGV